MGSLNNKRILLGITGGIAAYKCADLARRLRDAGADVRVVMTEAASTFVTPLTMQAVSGHPVHQHLLNSESESAMGHIELARWADVLLLAPTSANFIAKLCQGRADDLLSTVCLATKAPIVLAPAMNQQMWLNPKTQNNIENLGSHIRILGPASGEQACGEHGPGRMLEPVELVDAIKSLFATGAMENLRLVITAGPTWEAIDAVRGISNRSSGKMGYAVAEAAAEAGANVILISGPVSLSPPERIETVSVTSALEMHDSVMSHIDTCDIFIAVAAVTDYRMADPQPGKIKKSNGPMTLQLVPNPDILASVASRPNAPFTVGFAAESDRLEQYAREKLASKGIDIIAANLIGIPDSGFDSDNNSLLVITNDEQTELSTQSKNQLARKLITIISGRYHAKNTTKNSRSQARE